MTTLYHSDAPAEASRAFGRGILRSVPTYVATDRTAADEAWLVADNARREAADLDRRGAEALAFDRMTAGYDV